ncbi:hypothetical protein MNQ98_08555 [Paenibacillus sp. N3/727]|uniref:hypothetical protein n=1 Tax=Paenibacillus sp. N3/727 TaxID=2925845 RepID=UPI001F538384|nr:hypothetical protein [Paenibacillus sp. N3/727]UNK20052.1 hypothetical protein MNQ98_08555 [Paenibacillus sp. N3/727]
MEWILDNIYIVAGIVFFLLSALGKLGKGSDENKPNRMPTFGGGGDSAEQGPRAAKAVRPGQQVRRVQPWPGAEVPTGQAADKRSRDQFDDDDDEKFDPYYEEPDRTYESPVESRYDVLSELDDPHSARDSMEQRKRNMQAELDQIHKQLDRMTSHIPETLVEVTDADGKSPRKQSNFAEEVRKGVIWSEILGPPRSKRPMGRRH